MREICMSGSTRGQPVATNPRPLSSLYLPNFSSYSSQPPIIPTIWALFVHPASAAHATRWRFASIYATF
jgi:hypothetical protein